MEAKCDLYVTTNQWKVRVTMNMRKSISDISS